MSAPAAVIRLELESLPRLSFDCISDSEERRLVDWLNTNDDLLELIGHAVELQDEEAAA